MKSLEDIGEPDCSEWSKEEKIKFEAEIFRLRKDFKSLSKEIRKSMESCWAYYLRFFKRSDRYRLLKVIIAEERNDRSAFGDGGLDACAICGNGGSLIICDGCEGEYHISCLRPPLRSVPEGTWECDECVDRNFLESRDNLFQNASVFTRPEKKRRLTESDNEGSKDDLLKIGLRPASPVEQAVRDFARKLNELLSPFSVSNNRI